MMAMVGKMIAEVEQLVPAGELDPNNIHTRILVCEFFREQFEKN